MEFQGKKVFTTVFENKTDKTVRILEDGKVFFRLAAGGTTERHAVDPGKSYAAFSRVTFTKKGEVEVEKNKAWTPPEYWGKDCLITEFLNLGQNEVEALRIDGELIECYRAVPRYAPIHRLNNEFALVEKVVWREGTRDVPDPALSNMYLMTIKVTDIVKTPRSNAVIRDIQKRLQEEAKSRAEKESDKTMKRLAEGIK
jgi:hypothetical protein